MKKVLMSLTVCLITMLILPSCSAYPADSFDFKVTQMWGDKYCAMLEVNIERRNGHPIKELEIECSSEDVGLSYSTSVYNNIAIADLDVSWIGAMSGMGDETGLNGKSVKVVLTEITVDGVKYTGNWTLEHTMNVQTESKHLYLSDSKPKNDLRFFNIEVSPYSIIYSCETNGFSSESWATVKFFRKDSSDLFPKSSSYMTGQEDDSPRCETSGVQTFPSGIDINDIGFVEFDGEIYALTDKEPSPTL